MSPGEEEHVSIEHNGEAAPDLHGFALGFDGTRIYGDHLAMYQHPAHKYHVVVEFEIPDAKHRELVVNSIKETGSTPHILVNNDKKLLLELIKGEYQAVLMKVPGSDVTQAKKVAGADKIRLVPKKILHSREFSAKPPAQDFSQPDMLLFGTPAGGKPVYLSRYMSVKDDYQQLVSVTLTEGTLPSGIDAKGLKVKLVEPKDGTDKGNSLKAGGEAKIEVDGAEIKFKVNDVRWHDISHYRAPHEHREQPMAELLAAALV